MPKLAGMDVQQSKAISKYLSYILRHAPEEAGITLDENGWANVALLLQELYSRFPMLDTAMLEYIVATNGKQRFAFNEDKTLIRASQGHSINVELNLLPQEPPFVLFHGTCEKNIATIMKEGLLKQQRHHVHLSESVSAARQVGSRHGRPFVLKILSSKMQEDDYKFFISANNVWLTEHVPVAYLVDDF